MQRTIYSGIKPFSDAKCSIEITIVEHPDFDVFEIIAVESLGRIEAEHVFLDAILLHSLLKKDGCNENCDDVTAAFIFARICVTSYLPASKVLAVEVRSSTTAGCCEALMVSKPKGVCPSSLPISG
jgi:hypothetical protein